MAGFDISGVEPSGTAAMLSVSYLNEGRNISRSPRLSEVGTVFLRYAKA